MHETRILSEYVAGLTLSDIPPEVVRRIKQLILDQLACEVAGSTLPWTRAVYDATRLISGSGPSPVVVFGDLLPVDEAAFVNSALGHGTDFDEATLRTHPGSVVVPAAFAVAAMDPTVDGEKLLVAIAAGCEIMLRVTEAAMPALKDVRFHNTASSTGSFGAAAAVARACGLDPRTTEHALAIAGYQSAGLMQHMVGGGSARRLQTAIGAKSGVRAAWFAANGLTGPTEILEGSQGFLQSFAGEFDPSRLTDGLGESYLSSHPCLKRFSVKYRIHSTIDALVALVERHHMSFDQIANIRVGVSESTRRAYGVDFEPAKAPDHSLATQAAQFSIRFAMAVVAKFGPAVLSNLGPAEFHDPDVLDLARRVDVYREPELEREPWMSWGSDVSVTMVDGHTVATNVARPLGSPENPMGEADVEEKFHRLVDPVLGAEHAAAVVSAIWSLEAREPRADILPRLVTTETRDERAMTLTG